MILHLDFETRSDVDLRASGLYVYARGRNTDLMCAAYAFDDEPVQLWLPGDSLPRRFVDHVESGGEVWAHNASFERELCNCVASRKYGWPHLYDDQLVCTMAMSYAMGLPGHLGSTAAALGVATAKDMAGNRIMLQYCVPRDTVDGKIIWWGDPEKLQQIYAYCKTDVEVERQIGHRMMRLSPYERNVWILDQKINSRGIHVDTPAVTAAIKIVESEKKRLDEEMRRVSNNEIATCSAVAQIKTYLGAHSFLDIEGLAKSDVVELLSEKMLPENCKAVLRLRQEAGKAATAKLDRMLSGASADNRIRGSFQYSGANTRRWAGRGLQLQNLRRPSFKPAVINEILEELPKGLSAPKMEVFYGQPLDVLGDCIRGFLTAAPGYEFLCCDFSAIEARVIAWLAGQESVLQVFRTHGKIYEYAAASIFGTEIEKVTESQRQVGKVASLALGFGGGVGAFQAMAKGYSVDISAAFENLFRLADFEQRSRVEESFVSNASRYEGITREGFIASDLTKMFWREANPAIVRLWAALENAAISAVKNPSVKFTSGKIAYKMSGSFLWCQLPSGGVLSYPYPSLKAIKTPWGETKTTLHYKTEENKKWVETKTYGGSLAENVTQAVARDLLADAMLRLESKNYPIVAHIHDEIVCELPTGKGSIVEMSQIMSEVPVWAEGLPLKAAGWNGFRYRK